MPFGPSKDYAKMESTLEKSPKNVIVQYIFVHTFHFPLVILKHHNIYIWCENIFLVRIWVCAHYKEYLDSKFIYQTFFFCIVQIKFMRNRIDIWCMREM